MPGLRISQGGSSMTWLTIVTSQCWRHRSELKMQNLETPLRAGCLGFFCRSQPRLFFNMWGFRLILYYNLLIRAFMRNWLTHAEVSARGIQIHPYSQVWSTHFVKGCFAEHHSILSFSCFSLPSPTWFPGPASLWCPLQACSAHQQLPLLVESQSSPGSPSGCLPTGEEY